MTLALGILAVIGCFFLAAIPAVAIYKKSRKEIDVAEEEIRAKYFNDVPGNFDLFIVQQGEKVQSYELVDSSGRKHADIAVSTNGKRYEITSASYNGTIIFKEGILNNALEIEDIAGNRSRLNNSLKEPFDFDDRKYKYGRKVSGTATLTCNGRVVGVEEPAGYFVTRFYVLLDNELPERTKTFMSVYLSFAPYR